MNPGPDPGSGRDDYLPRRGGDPGDPLCDGDGESRLTPSGTDWMDDERWAARQASRAGEEEPDGPERYEDPDHSPPPGLDDAQLAELIAGAREVIAGVFGAGTPLDAGPGCTALMGFADEAAGTDNRYSRSSDALISAFSPLVMPGRSPASTWAWRSHLRTVSGDPIPSRAATALIAAYSLP